MNATTVSATFSIAVHASVFLLLTGVVLFPQSMPRLPTQLEVILASDPSDQDVEALLEADKNQSGEQLATRVKKSVPNPPSSQAKSSQGLANAQWSSSQPTLDKAASRQSQDAAYLAHWRDRVEAFGTQVYQGKIKQVPHSGEVQIVVKIGAKGQLLDAQVRHSSGNPSLDAIALDILRKAAPFDPLPPGKDSLEITRTWRFTAQGMHS